MKPQLGQRVGFRPASNARRPTGNRKMATMIAHAGNPPREASVLHFGQVIFAIEPLSFNDSHRAKETIASARAG
jgi:hypothetical protein